MITTQRHPSRPSKWRGTSTAETRAATGTAEKLRNWLKAKASPARFFGCQFGNVRADRNHLYAQADAGQKAPQIDGRSRRLQSHHERTGGIPEQGEAENCPSAQNDLKPG